MFNLFKEKPNKKFANHLRVLVNHLLSKYDYDDFEMFPFKHDDQKTRDTRTFRTIHKSSHDSDNDLVYFTLNKYPNLNILLLKRNYLNYTDTLEIPFIYGQDRFVFPATLIDHRKFIYKGVDGADDIESSVIRTSHLEFDISNSAQGLSPVLELNYSYEKEFPIIDNVIHQKITSYKSDISLNAANRFVEVLIKQHKAIDNKNDNSKDRVIFVFELWHNHILIKKNDYRIDFSKKSLGDVLQEFLFPFNLKKEVYQDLEIVPELTKEFIDSLDEDTLTLMKMIAI